MDTLNPSQRERAAVVLNGALHRRAKSTAARLGIPLGRLAQDAIEAELSRLERRLERRKPESTWSN